MSIFGNVNMKGSMTFKVIRNKGTFMSKKWFAIKAWRMKQMIRYGWREIPLTVVIFLLPLLKLICPGLMVVHSKLGFKVIKANGEVWDYGTIGRHLITTAGKNFLAACMDNTSEPELLKFHAFGTGSTAAAVGDTTLTTELTTQYAVSSTRPTGSQAHSANTYTTVGTITLSSGATIAEWGLMSQAATGGGTLYDHQVFTGLAFSTGEGLQITYVLTFS